MELSQIFSTIMEQAIHITLATSVENQPNVRIVTFAYDESQKDRLFFTTFKSSQKVHEFTQNQLVACMPLPKSSIEENQVRIFGKVQKSNFNIDTVISIIEKKCPDSASTIKQGKGMIDVYEIIFSKASVTIGVGDAQFIML